MSYFLTLTPRDPLVARDGRPFGVGQGNRMRSLNWPYPSVLAGALRTLLGKMTGGDFTAALIEALKRLEVGGPFLQAADELYFPAPADLVVWEDEKASVPAQRRTVMPLRPMSLHPNEKICDLPDGLVPVSVTQDVKPAATAAFWSKTRICHWLLNASGQGFVAPPTPEKAILGSGCLSTPEKEERTHVKIDPRVGAAEESLLFMTVGLDLSVRHSPISLTLAARVDGAQAFDEQVKALDTFHPLGGERRLVHWSLENSTAWNYPKELQDALHMAPRVRLILATPAVFKEGWKPGWLNDQLEGCPPGMNVRLRLLSACVERWKPLSGWSLEDKQVGPKAIRRLAAAGNVYFFTVIDGDATTLIEKRWLRSVSDDDQDRRDGFGLALWGVWDPAK